MDKMSITHASASKLGRLVHKDMGYANRFSFPIIEVFLNSTKKLECQFSKLTDDFDIAKIVALHFAKSGFGDVYIFANYLFINYFGYK